jgi:predicted nuclease with TOPRIM domain
MSEASLEDQFLELLKKNEKFRLAVASYLGYNEILRKLSEHDEKFNSILEEIKLLREGQEKLWEEVKALREEQNKLWEGQNRLWKEVKYLRAEVDSFGKAVGRTLEDYTVAFVRVILEDKGYSKEKVNIRKTTIIHDNKIVEIDIFNEDPLIVGEVTTYLDTVEQAKEEINKILYDKEVVERKFKRKVEMKILAVANVPSNVLEELKKLTEDNEITFIFGRELVQEI